MGAPLSGRVAEKHSTAVYDLDAAAAAQHSKRYGSVAISDADQLRELTGTARFIVTCLPNTHLTRKTLDTVRPALREGTLWVDATSGRAEDAAALAAELWDGHGVRYLDCAVSGGPRGAERGVLAALIGGDRAAFEDAAALIGCFSRQATHLGPAGSGHLVKSINNALLAAHVRAPPVCGPSGTLHPHQC